VDCRISDSSLGKDLFSASSYLAREKQNTKNKDQTPTTLQTVLITVCVPRTPELFFAKLLDKDARFFYYLVAGGRQNENQGDPSVGV
jgi:hypothetical protein